MNDLDAAQQARRPLAGRDEIIAIGLDAAAWEMCASLIRTAYSPNVKERADCSTALCDLQGRTLALATYAPAHLGSTLKVVGAILARFPLEEMRPGDAFLANDPYIVGVTHLNDCTVAAPVFVDGKPVAFTAAVAHQSDVGGRVPGSESGDSTSIFQEGIRIPPVKLLDQGVLRRDIWELVLLNSRTPHFNEGDLRAQTAANERGAQRLQALYARYGTEDMTQAIGNMLDACERRARERIRSVLAPGRYSAEDWLDEDGVSDTPVRLAVDLTADDGRLVFDFSRSAAQLGSGKNIPYTHLMATVYFCTVSMIDPALPVNEGLYRVIEVVSPEGNVTNARAPAGVSSRNLTSMILADAIMNALGQAAPGRATAAGGPYQGIIVSGQDPRLSRFYVDYENYAGGQGGSAVGDGADVMQLHTTNTSNLPIEVTELEFPLRVERYEMICDSGGAGRHRGGLGVRRDLRLVAPQATLALRSARQRFEAKGLRGGGSGSLGAYRLDPEADGSGGTRLPSTLSEHPLADGVLLRIETPGGGGYGDPRERDAALVAYEVLQQRISVHAARELYGVVVAADGRLDEAATRELRSNKA